MPIFAMTAHVQGPETDGKPGHGLVENDSAVIDIRSAPTGTCSECGVQRTPPAVYMARITVNGRKVSPVFGATIEECLQIALTRIRTNSDG